MSNLSPTTQAAWDAYNDVLERAGVFEDHGDALAAFLRVIAETVIPDPEYCVPDSPEIIREDLIDIASELERIHNNPTREQALTALHAIASGANDTPEQYQDFETIRAALNRLPPDI